jgi:hypothetical protein
MNQKEKMFVLNDIIFCQNWKRSLREASPRPSQREGEIDPNRSELRANEGSPPAFPQVEGREKDNFTLER